LRLARIFGLLGLNWNVLPLVVTVAVTSPATASTVTMLQHGTGCLCASPLAEKSRTIGTSNTPGAKRALIMADALVDFVCCELPFV
jgi:hypothetical protein